MQLKQLEEILHDYAWIDDTELGEDKFMGHYNIKEATQALTIWALEVVKEAAKNKKCVWQCMPDEGEQHLVECKNVFSAGCPEHPMADGVTVQFAYNQAIDTTLSNAKSILGVKE